VTKCSQGPRCVIGVGHLQKAKQSWKHRKTTPPAGKVMVNIFWDSQSILFIDLLIEQWTISTAYYSKLPKDRVKPAFCSKWQGQSVRSVSPPQQHVPTCCHCDNRNIGGNVLRGTVTPHLWSWPDAKQFSSVQSTKGGHRRKKI
jgi:hypothetical protein